MYIYNVSCCFFFLQRYPVSKVLLKFPRAGPAQSKFALCIVCKANSSFIRAPGTRLPGRACERVNRQKKDHRMDEKRGHYKNLFMTARFTRHSVISLVEVITEASCRLTGISEISSLLRCTWLFRSRLSLSLSL